mmetsp:Transcript_64554/g.102360  ORF Transcript_64554/g.102360 Transcript_64554/m.102360 type:complete len:243 (-) Transcript_64554:1574-2302(-)
MELQSYTAELTRWSGLLLQQREVCPGENGFCLQKVVHFLGSRSFTELKILNKPIAFLVQLHLVHLCRFQFFRLRLLCRLVGYLPFFCVSFRRLLGGDGFRVGCSLLCRIIHHFLVFFLAISLFDLGLRDLFIKVPDEKVDHRQHAAGFFGLLRVCSPSCWWCFWCILALLMLVDLHERSDTSAGDATRCRCWGKRASHRRRDLLLLGELSLWWGFIKLGIVELVQSILCKCQQFFSSVVGTE